MDKGSFWKWIKVWIAFRLIGSWKNDALILFNSQWDFWIKFVCLWTFKWRKEKVYTSKTWLWYNWIKKSC